MRSFRLVWWLAALVTIALLAAGVVFTALARPHGDPWWVVAIAVVVVLVSTAVGLLVAGRHPGHPIAWLLLANALLLASWAFTASAAEYTLFAEP